MTVPYKPKHYLKQNKQVLPFNAELEVEVDIDKNIWGARRRPFGDHYCLCCKK